MSQVWSGLTVLFAVCATLVSSGSQKFPGPCPAVKSMNNLDINAFNGTWYEIGHYNRGFPGCGDFTTYTFSRRINGYNVKFEKSGTIISFAKFTRKPQGGAAFFGGIQHRDYTPEEYHFHIISTDYNCVAVIYTCKTIGDHHISSAYLLSKVPNGMCYILSRKVTQVHRDAQELPDLEFENYETNDHTLCNNKH